MRIEQTNGLNLFGGVEMSIKAITFGEYCELAQAGKIKEIPFVKCAQCGVVLQETITGNRRVGDDRVCSDCYFRGFDELIEERPIGVPHARR
jgi:hypothetical protein